ncbi:hypothetical protein H4582DRAFT_2013278 [Lactarius indigo]|nr:hypothetical protein H4582DRAFT_2013278 [Lactarius indigo]
MFGKLMHLGFDALLISAFLAGVKRTTGLTPALSQVPNKDVRQLLRSYLELGTLIIHSSRGFCSVLRCAPSRQASMCLILP